VLIFTGLESPTRLLIILVVILLFFGGKRIPAFARGLGKRNVRVIRTSRTRERATAV
jgi:TatA/E family protein of Tat protein translocase